MLLRDGQVHHDTHPIPMGNYVIAVGNYVSVSPSDLGNYVSADTHESPEGSANPRGGRAAKPPLTMVPQKSLPPQGKSRDSEIQPSQLALSLD